MKRLAEFFQEENGKFSLQRLSLFLTTIIVLPTGAYYLIATPSKELSLAAFAIWLGTLPFGQWAKARQRANEKVNEAISKEIGNA